MGARRETALLKQREKESLCENSSLAEEAAFERILTSL